MEKSAVIKQMMLFAGEVRGIVIEGCIMIERKIDYYLSKYYCEDNERRLELSDLFTQYLNLEFKRALYMRILNKNHNEEIELYSKELKGIENMMVERNVLAHMELDTSDTAIEKYITTGVIQFIKYRKIVSSHEITTNLLDTFQKNLTNGVKVLDHFQKKQQPGRNQ